MDIVNKRQMNFLENIDTKYNKNLHLSFFLKKSERVLSALYLISGSFEDEALKKELRKISLEFFSLTQDFYYSESLRDDRVIRKLEIKISKIFYSLSLAQTINLISNDNFEVLKKELNLLLSLLKNQENFTETKGQFLGVDYFKIKDKKFMTREIKNVLADVKDNYSENKGQTFLNKGQKSFIIKKDKTLNIVNPLKKNGRRDKISEILSKGQKLTIKDISKEIDDCSEKTIQRELSSMLKDNVLSKEGERRWSKYFLSEAKG